MDGLKDNGVESLVLEFVLNSAVFNNQVEVVVVLVPQSLHVDACETHVNDFLSDCSEHPDEADPDLRYLQQILKTVLDLQLVVLPLQLQLLNVVLKAKNQP